ncbi:MAG: ATP-binding protein [Nanobdellota archaeon]
MYKRTLKQNIEKNLFKGKAIVIVGARQVGKTTLVDDIIEPYKSKTFNCDNPTEREILNNKDIEFLEGLFADYDVIFIDEAQKVASIGQTIKLLVDYFKKKKQFIITGSSSINLLDSTSEPLTGRKNVFHIYPLSLKEIYSDKLNMKKHLENHMVFGNYPEIASNDSYEDKIKLLKEISSSYLYKDILEFQKIKNSEIIFKLLRALSLQLGNEVSYNELANLLGIDKKTVQRYIDLLEKNYVVFKLPAFKKNQRRNLKTKNKIYFYDLGIRNAIINNFNFIDSRNDTGPLFENLCILEKIKFNEYNNIYSNYYFWRTYDGAEVDLVEERSGKLIAYEFKYNSSKAKKHDGWDNFIVVNKNNFYKLFDI